jgi:metal-responsive CopG/Arc/MetJ family transcriptional regulator
MNENKYISVKIPKQMGDVLDNYIEQSTITYSSRAELVKEILRKHFNEEPKTNGGNGGNGGNNTSHLSTKKHNQPDTPRIEGLQ